MEAGPVSSGAGADPLASRLPVTVITGFLGSGKTTLLRCLLRDPGMNRAAVIINEFGEVGLDHELVEASSEQMTLLSNGCLCCTVRTDLQETLRELFVKRRSGEVIDFDRVFVETSGLADPAPVLHALASDGLLRVKGIVNVEGEAGPVIIHGVQHIFHPPLKLERWRDAERRSRIVFIVRNIPRELIQGLFGAVGMLEKKPGRKKPGRSNF